MIEVQSQAFGPNERIPLRYTGEGEDLSPPLGWTAPADGVAEFALICDDPDAPMPKPFVHWVAYKIPATQHAFEEGATGEDVVEGKNDIGNSGYGGPMPPRGHGTHRYFFKVYALDQAVTLKAGATKEELLAAIEGHVVDEGELIGTYERK